VKSGGEFLVNTSTASTQAEPTLAALPSGGFVAVWTHNNPGDDPFGLDVRGQIFDANGVKVGPEFPVNGSTDGNQYRATVTATANGGFLANWTEETSFIPDTPEGIAAQEFAADGTMIGPELLINNVTTNLQVVNAVAQLGNGDLFFAWEDYSGIDGDMEGTAIKARLFTAATPATERDDTISGTAGDDRWIALGGNDVLLMQQGGNDEADGGAGNDLFYYGGAFTASDTADGAGGRDTLILQGRYADLRLTAESLSDVETIALWSAGDNRYGGAGGPPARYVITSADGNVASGRFLTVDARQLLPGEQAIFDGSAETDGSFYFHGGAGNDNFTGGLGRDTIDGGAGGDVMAGGGNNDVYFVDNVGDLVLEAVGNGGFDAVYTRVNYVLRAGSEVEQLAAAGLALGQAIALTGNEFSQSLISGSGNDDLKGGGGADFLTANAGNDRLNGGTGIDVMNGGAGNDVYFVDNIGDVVVELAGEGSDSVYASTTYQLSGGAEVELLATTGLAPGQAITLFGNDFAQSVIGATGADTLYGFAGNDSLVGNEGADTLDGGAGDDGLRGGAGADIFQFTAMSDSTGAGDNIFDFLTGTDRIDVSLIDANTNADGNHAFTFIGSSAFSGTAGELRVESSGGLVNVLGDVDGNGVADLIVHLYNTGGTVPTASDFVL
jgi:Ca2+-binding RTX toxin-like protein